MSLIVPKQYLNFNMVAIDPGLNNCGVAIFNIDYTSKKILSITAETIVTEKLRNYTGLDNEWNGERLVKLHKLKEAITNRLIEHTPCIVACEAPFYNPLRPNAFKALVEAIAYIQLATVEYNHNTLFHTIPPLSVKQAVRAGSTKGKVDVKDCVSKIPEIMDVLVGDLQYISEHGIDAIAVGYSFLKQTRDY